MITQTMDAHPYDSSPSVDVPVDWTPEDELLPADIGLDLYGRLLTCEEREEVSRNLLGFLRLLLEIDAEAQRAARQVPRRGRPLRHRATGSSP